MWDTVVAAWFVEASQAGVAAWFVRLAGGETWPASMLVYSPPLPSCGGGILVGRLARPA